MAVTKKTPVIVQKPNSFCPGCGHGILNRVIAEVVEEKGYIKNHCMVLAVGCSCNMNNSWAGEHMQSAHGRGSAVARGMKVAMPDSLIMDYHGDGDAYVIGLAETLNAAYVNAPITVFVVNNNNFGMTGGQMSWTTMPGQVTTTSTKGRDVSKTGAPFKMPEMIAHSFDVAYVARGSVHSAKEIMNLKKYVTNAIEAQLNGEGYSFIEVLAPCPTNWGLTMPACVDWMEKEVIPYFTLGEFKKRGDK